jgi:hypothetical protein
MRRGLSCCFHVVTGRGRVVSLAVPCHGMAPPFVREDQVAVLIRTHFRRMMYANSLELISSFGPPGNQQKA